MTLVIGAGYVGTAIAKALQIQGDEVTVTTTTASKVVRLENLGFKVLLAAIDDPLLIEAAQNFQRILFAVAPHQAEEAENVYLAPAKLLKKLSKKPSQVIYTSSTGVYGSQKEGWVHEESILSPVTPREKLLVQAEDDLKSVFPGVAILRLGGIIGPERELKHRLGSPLAGSREQPFNWVALEDIVGAALFILEKQLVGTFNVISKEGMTRGQAYQAVANQEGMTAPQFDPSISLTHGGWRWVSNKKLRQLGYQFCGVLQ